MKSAALFMLVLVATTQAGDPLIQQGRTTVREFEIPRPPAVVREYVPVDREVPQPPRRIQEVTTTYLRELADYNFELPAPRAYALPERTYTLPEPRAYTVPAYVLPGRRPVESYQTGLFHLRKNVVFSDGSIIQYGPLGKPRYRD